MGAHTVVDPGAVVIVPINTAVTYMAVEHLTAQFAATFRAERRLDIHQRHRLPLTELLQQQEVQHKYQQLVDALKHQRDNLNEFGVDIEL